MNKDKVYLKGYVIGRAADTLGYKGLQIQLENMDIVEIDENLVHKGINEPQKPVVPQFVADWYEENKDDFEGNLYRFTRKVPTYFDGAKLNDFERWFISNSTKIFQTLVNMHQFGYTVEKEKRYSVMLKGITGGDRYLKRVATKWIISGSDEHEYMHIHTAHTRKELEEAGFGWVFDCEGIEIEEVE